VVKKRIEQSMSVVEIKILKWMKEMTRENRIRNEYKRNVNAFL